MCRSRCPCMTAAAAEKIVRGSFFCASFGYQCRDRLAGRLGDPTYVRSEQTGPHPALSNQKRSLPPSDGTEWETRDDAM